MDRWTATHWTSASCLLWLVFLSLFDSEAPLLIAPMRDWQPFPFADLWLSWIMEIPKYNNLAAGTLPTNVHVPAPFCSWIKGIQEWRIPGGVLSLWHKLQFWGLGSTASFFNTISLVFHLSALSQSFWFADISFWFLWVIMHLLIYLMSFLSCLQILLRRGGCVFNTEFWNRIHHYFFLSRVNKFYMIFNVV